MKKYSILTALVFGAAFTVTVGQARAQEPPAAQEAQPQVDREAAEAHRNRGVELMREQKYREAAEELEQAIRADPKDAYAHYYLGMANSRLKKKDLMIKHFQIFLELAPEAPEAERVRSLLKSL